jgi:hypothetical protein
VAADRHTWGRRQFEEDVMSVAFDHTTTDQTMSADATEPHFTHRIQPLVALLIGALLTVLILASFFYGQFAPGI